MIDGIWKATILLTAVGVVAIALILVGILREMGAIMLQVGPPREGDVDEGPEIGSEVTEPGLARARPSLFIFVTPSCSLCKPVVEALPTVQAAYPSVGILPLIVGTSSDDRASYAASIPLPSRTDKTELFTEWSIPGTPFAVGVDRTNRIVARGIVNNLPQLEAIASKVEIEGSPDTVNPRTDHTDSVSGGGRHGD
jgi:hypothetical protein